MTSPPDAETGPLPPSPATAPPVDRRPARRLHPLALGTVAATVALGAAFGVAALLAPTGPLDESAPEVELRFSGTDEDPEPPSLVGRDPAGQPLPDGNFSMLAGGLGSFADYRGAPLVVNFFASWCVPCVAEMPAFESVHQELGAEVGFLGVNLRDGVADATALVERTGVTYDIARDPDGELAGDLGVVAMPSTVFVSSDGTIVATHAGELSADDLRGRLGALFG